MDAGRFTVVVAPILNSGLAAKLLDAGRLTVAGPAAMAGSGDKL